MNIENQTMKLRTLLLPAMCCIFASSCGKPFVNMDNEEFAGLIADKDSVQLVDVRTAGEFDEMHIPYAVNIDVNDNYFIPNAEEKLDAGKPVAVYCRSGKRSASAAELLAGKGFNVINLKNGILSWIEDGRVVADKNDYIVFDGQEAPDFTTTVYGGGDFKLSDLRGKVVMLQFTASWCGICRREMPFIEKDIWQKHKDNEDFVLMAVDLKEEDSKIAEMIEGTGISYPVARDPEAAVFNLYNLKGAGVTRNVLIDREGKIVMRTRRYHEEEFATLVAKIDEMLK